MKKVLPWVAVIWGGLIVLNGVAMLLSGGGEVNSAYSAGRMGGFVIGGLMLFAGIRAIMKGDEE